MFHIIQQSCLEKITPDCLKFKKSFNKGSALIGEEFAYQIVLYNDEEKAERFQIKQLYGLPNHLYLVKQVPITWPHYSSGSSDEYLLNGPGVMPDCLVPVEEGSYIIVSSLPTVIWVSIHAASSGTFDCGFRFISDSTELECNFELELIDHEMAPVSFRYYEHIYATSVANDCRAPTFTDVHWNALEKYFDLAANHGITDVLTPIYPAIYPSSSIIEPLQLVHIEKMKNGYQFNFDLFDCWIFVAKRKGIKNFLLPPLFPNLVDCKALPFICFDGKKSFRLFDDNVAGDALDYRVFLSQFLRSFHKHLTEENLIGFVTFQLTDRVERAFIGIYEEYKKWFLRIVPNVRLIDFVSDVHLYRRINFGIPCVPMHRICSFGNDFPVQGILHFDPCFHTPVADMLIAGDATRMRTLGILSYRHNLGGLLNRGFNFNSSVAEESNLPMNLNLDAGNSFPSGTLSLIYSGPDGPMPSVRLKLLYYAMQDIRVLEALERYMPHEKIRSLIDKKCPIYLDRANTNAEKLLSFREMINQIFKEYRSI